ncbi:retrovirus-related pol polyprotein from transposon TNT 1-94 [Tanacetum coccineum]
MPVTFTFFNSCQPGMARFVTLVKPLEKIDTITYTELFDILKQFQKEVNDIRAERIAKSANPLALLAAAQPYSDTYYQAPKPQRSNATSSSHTLIASTRQKAKSRANQLHLSLSRSLKKTVILQQAQRDKEMQKNLALLAKYFKKLYKLPQQPFKLPSNSRQTEDTTLKTGIQPLTQGIGTMKMESRKPKRLKTRDHKEKMMNLEHITTTWPRFRSLPEESSTTWKTKTILKQLKKATIIDSRMENCKTNLDETNVVLGELLVVEDSCQLHFRTNRKSLRSGKAVNDDRLIDEILQTKLNETLGLLALKDIEIKEGLKTKAYEISVLDQKHDDLVKKSLLTKSQLEGYLKENTKVISDLKVKEEKDIDKMIEMDKQLKFLNEIVYTRNQSIQTIHMLAPKCSTYNGRPTFANPRYLKKAQSEKPCLYEIPYDTSDLANRFAPDREETMTLDNESRSKLNKDYIVQLILFIVDSGCTKHMTGNLKLFGSRENVTIKRVYYVEGLNHNLFSVGQFCDADLEVAFRKSTCFVRDLQGNDLLTGNRGSDLYTISLQETTSSTPICFMAKASPTQAWLWHRRLSHLNFDYITLLSKKDIVTGLPKLKYVKDQLCSSCEMSKAKRSSFKSKAVPSSKGRLNLLHMDLCGPMRVASINGKKYILVIVDDYSRYTWTLFLRSKDETPEVLKDFLTMIQRNLQAQVISVRTDRGTEFLNKTLHAYFKEEGIEHQTSTPRTPEQNGVVERRNRTLVEAARTMLSASKLPLSFWAEAVATACYTQNRSIIISTHGKTAYHIINDRKPSIKHLHIFGCICYITRDGENLDKMKEKGDPCVMVGYSTQSKGYRVYNKRTRLIVESIHIKFDEIKEMMSDHNSSDLAPQRQEMSVENVTSGLVPQGQKASDYDNSDPVPPRQNVVPIAEKINLSQQGLEFLFSPLLEEYYNPAHGHAEDNNNDQAPNASF